MHALRRSLVVVCATMIAASSGCRKTPGLVEAPFCQRGYLWQRHWDGNVEAAAEEAGQRLDGIILLGAEIEWHQGTPEVIKANIPWGKFRGKAVALGLRVAPFPGPFAENDARAQLLCHTAKALLEDAASQGTHIKEVQLDFDCAQKKLAGYAEWVRAVRSAVAPLPLVITALPGWMGEKEFPPLVREADGYVLQVHSVPVKSTDRGRTLCDPQAAREWVEQAASIGLPFSVALPTYRCVAGYGSGGKLLGVAMDSVPLSWPPGTATVEFATDAADVADLVAWLRDTRPRGLKELIWYRVPVASDMRNWGWPTLAAVMQGREPTSCLKVLRSGENPTDFALINNGESDEPLACTVKVAWDGARPTSWDALDGWELKVDDDTATFSVASGCEIHLPPGGRRDMGWIRYDRAASPRAEVCPPQTTPAP